MTLRFSLILIVLYFVFATTHSVAQNAQTQNKQSTASEENAASGADGDKSVPLDPARLNAIASQIDAKAAEAKEIRAKLAALAKGEDDTELKERLAETTASLATLKINFSQIVTDGITFDAEKTPDKPYNWQDELVDVIKPVLGGLKEITEKPRRIEEIRARIETLHSQRDRASEALAALKKRTSESLSPTTVSSLDSLREQWDQRRSDAVNAIDVAEVQLQALESKGFSYQVAIVDPIKDFFLGRGLTLLIALGVALAIWYLLNLLFKPVTRRLFSDLEKKQRRTRERVIAYLFRAFVATMIAVGILMVFYFRSDMLLLALSVLVIAGIAIAMRSLVPKYIGELRILLNAGSVREGERLVHQGVPMEVKSINAFAILRNPELEGIVRLPLSDLHSLRSRPCGPEPWFPSKVGDTLLLGDGSMATVMRQTLEVVQLRTAGTVVDQPTGSFVTSGPKNISRDGFLHATTFGIDYEHQDICLTVVPDAFRDGVQSAFDELPIAPNIESVSVSFKEAATNSLDFLVLVNSSGEAAGSYFAIGRVIQKALVQVCNERGWGIPFAQMTIHAGDGLAVAKNPS